MDETGQYLGVQLPLSFEGCWYQVLVYAASPMRQCRSPETHNGSASFCESASEPEACFYIFGEIHTRRNLWGWISAVPSSGWKSQSLRTYLLYLYWRIQKARADTLRTFP